MFFYRQLSTLIIGGVSIIEAIGILVNHGLTGELKGVAEQIKQYLLSGQSLAEAFGRFPSIFPGWQVSIINYSEKSGRLADGLGRLADYLEKDYANLMRVVVGLAYPVFLLHVAIFLLPLANLSCSGGYIFSVLKSLITLYGGVFLIYWLMRAFNSPQLRSGFDSFILALPIIGNIARQFAVARFVRALQCLCASGVIIVDAWKTAAEACGNSIIKNMALGAVGVLERGEELSKAFIAAQMLSPQMVGMVVAAERSGSIVQTLNTVAGYAEKDNESAMSALTGIIPVLVYLLIAGFIGMRIISFYSGYFQRITTF